MLVHQLRVCPSPDQLQAGFYWYGARRHSPGRVPNWLQRLLTETANRECASSNSHNELAEPTEGRDVELEDWVPLNIPPDPPPDPVQTDQQEPSEPEPDLLMTEQLEITRQGPCKPVVDSEVRSGHYKLCEINAK